MQKKVLKEEALNITKEASATEVEGLRRHVEVHEMNLNAVSSD